MVTCNELLLLYKESPVTMKFFLIILLASINCMGAFCQESKKDSLIKTAAKDAVLKGIDTLKILKEFSEKACTCIASISTNNKDSKQIDSAISKCIDEQTEAYQMGVKMYRSLLASGKNKTITININHSSQDYKFYNYQIERYLRDSCKSLKIIISANDKESNFSMSKNEDALKEYNAGVDYFKIGKYEIALPYFEKAVSIDEKFAFAWDNIGVCNRHLGNYSKALEAYQKSLEFDPDGQTPLQNIPVVYEFMKMYDKALESYQNLLKHHPNDPEVYYGIGHIYHDYLKDYEKALESMCKAYNLYVQMKSPYRADAEKIINSIYSKMKASGNLDRFNEILKENNIHSN